MAICSFGDKATEYFFVQGKLKKATPWQGLARVVKRKLDMLDYASKLSDLKSPPSNQLEALKRDLVGFHSIRINDQWRLIFRWSDEGPKDVRVTDYH